MTPAAAATTAVSAGNKLFLIWTGIGHGRRSRDKNKYGNRGRHDTRAVAVLGEVDGWVGEWMDGEGAGRGGGLNRLQRVSGGAAPKRQICCLV